MITPVNELTKIINNVEHVKFYHKDTNLFLLEKCSVNISKSTLKYVYFKNWPACDSLYKKYASNLA